MSSGFTPAGSRYLQLAASLHQAIAHGVYAVGDRMPSVRELARSRAVSVTTAVNALRKLEHDGVINAAPRSGHFVALQPTQPPEPDTSRPPAVPTAIDRRRLALALLQAAGDPKCIDLAAAVPALDMLPLHEIGRLTAKLGRSGAEWSVYRPAPGLWALRMQLARRLVMMGCNCVPDDLMITDGASEAISLALRATCRPGDVVAIESPIFHGILQAIDSLGLRVLELPTHPRTGLMLEALRDALEEHPIRAVLVISNFNNPLGCQMPDEAKRELVEILAERNLPLIEDDIYGDLAHDGRRPSVAKFWDRAGGVLLCSSMSKSVGPGLRLGWIAGGRWHEKIQHLKTATTAASASLTQSVVAAYLAGGGYDRHLRRIRGLCAARCAAMSDAIVKSFPAGVRLTSPTGGFVLWVELPRHIDAGKLTEQARRDGIAIAPGHLFSAKMRYRHFIRLNAARWDAMVAGAIAHLGKLATALDRLKAKEPNESVGAGQRS